MSVPNEPSARPNIAFKPKLDIMAARQTAISAVLLLLLGCAAPEQTVSPEIDGSLTVNGAPAQHIEVFLGFTGDHDAPCPSVPAARTNKNGQFHIPARVAQHSSAKLTQNYLCFKVQDRLIEATLMLVKPDEARKYIAECRLPVPPDAYAEDKQVCQWRYG